jgi:hypothetical protein
MTTMYWAVTLCKLIGRYTNVSEKYTAAAISPEDGNGMCASTYHSTRRYNPEHSHLQRRENITFLGGECGDTAFWDTAPCSLVRHQGEFVALMMEAVRISETSVCFNETTPRRLTSSSRFTFIALFTRFRQNFCPYRDDCNRPPVAVFKTRAISSHQRLGLPNGLFLSGFVTKVLFGSRISPILATYCHVVSLM